MLSRFLDQHKSLKLESGKNAMPNNPQIKKSDLALLLLYFDKYAPIKGMTQFEKLVFLSQKEVLEKWKELDAPKFEFGPDRFGPLSTELYDELDFLKSVQMVDSTDDNFKITDKGQRFVQNRVFVRVPEHIRKAIESIKVKHGRESLDDLLRYVYTNYPEYTVKSEIRDKVLG